ncbi:hypothetical protein K438DRAFT_1806791 [Mycena galopus ATCC 62051]|nr:hypothetical protein K438DRAFT_1806791 [Mycena galopus ATCC 62051]
MVDCIDEEKGKFSGEQDDPSDEAAAAKLWAVYVSEASKYDKALIESWRADMEGILIFAGLFSAILTAFLIESYKTLNTDSGALTVQLLAQISQQIASSANSVPLQLTPLRPFIPSTTSLICNALWFISLGFSLACALLATLVEQWAREFLHRTDMLSAPVVRARIFSYLYYGLKKFRMHTVVEIIPFLLHVSLIFFFGGLVAFLVPVNNIMAIIAAILLIVVAAVYSALTLLPLRYLDSPYRTPLSSACWRLLQLFRSMWQHRHRQRGLKSAPSQDESMVEAMSRTAMTISSDRVERDSRALVWTMKSLVDDIELEPFVEAVPDLLWGPHTRRHAYDDHMYRLMQNTDVQLHIRISVLYNSCHTGILPFSASKRRQIICLKAFWALAVLSCENASRTVGFEAFMHIYANAQSAADLLDPETAPYFMSAKAIMGWTIFCTAQPRLVAFRQRLLDSLACRESVSTREGEDNIRRNLDLREGSRFLNRLYLDFSRLKLGVAKNADQLELPKLLELVEELLFHLPYNILFHYLEESSSLPAGSPPHQWDSTRNAIRLADSVPFSAFQIVLERTLRNVIVTFIDRINLGSEVPKLSWIETSVSILLSLWRPDNSLIPIPAAIIELLNGPQSDQALADVLRDRGDVEFYLWANFPATLSKGAADIMESDIYGPEVPREAVFIAFWRLASLPQNHHPHKPFSLNRDFVLEALLNNPDPAFTHISRSIAAMLKVLSLNETDVASLDIAEGQEDPLHWFNRVDRVFPRETANTFSMDVQPEWDTVRQCIWDRKAEALISALAEFLEHCSSGVSLPYIAVETLRRMNQLILPGAVHITHQLRLADSIQNICAAPHFADLLAVTVDFWCWHIYAEQRRNHMDQDQWDGPRIPWLTDRAARQKIKDAFMSYAEILVSEANTEGAYIRVHNILLGLDYWHPDSEPDIDIQHE